jgi:hypothetical protein
MKTCTVCKNEKSLESFTKSKKTKDGLNSACRICCKSRYEAWSRDNKEKLKEIRKKTDDARVDKRREYQRGEKSREYHRQWNNNNRDKINEQVRKRYAENPETRAARKASHDKWISKPENRNKLNLYVRKKRSEDPSFKIAHNVRNRLLKVLKGQRKYAKTMELIGCTANELKNHLEKQFSPGMTWENHGTYWHIDHIKPISWFNLSIEKEMREACHFTNLKPLTKVENLKKGNRWSEIDDIEEVFIDELMNKNNTADPLDNMATVFPIFTNDDLILLSECL